MKIFVSLLILIMLAVMVAGCVDFGDPTLGRDITSSSTEDKDDKGNNNEDNKGDSSDNPSGDEGKKEEEPTFDFNSWQLRLVNPWNAIPEGFDPELTLINKKYVHPTFKNAQFDARAVEHLHAMCEAALEDNIKLVIISAYRTNDFQTANFNRKVDRVMAANPNLTREEAEKEAEKVVARPGTSEHQVGLAIDFNSVEDSFRTTNEYKWLVSHCTDYGFILRYTAENQSKTGIIPEPWHYRYVGVEAAKKMEAENLCLEDFIAKYKD